MSHRKIVLARRDLVFCDHEGCEWPATRTTAFRYVYDGRGEGASSHYHDSRCDAHREDPADPPPAASQIWFTFNGGHFMRLQ